MEKDKLDELARRAMSCAEFRWMPGMLAWRINHHGERVPVRMLEHLACPEVAGCKITSMDKCESGHAEATSWNQVSGLFPDFSDPASVGCLLQLVLDAWNGKIILRQGHKRWCIEGEGHAFTRGSSYVEGLVAALEDAPPKARP